MLRLTQDSVERPRALLRPDEQFPLHSVAARILTVPELAKYFGIPKGRVYAMLRREVDSGFPGFRAGRGWRVDLEQMREWMCQQVEEKVAFRRSFRARQLVRKR